MEKLKLGKFQKLEIKEGNLVRGGASKKGDHYRKESPVTCGGDGCSDAITERCDDPSTGDTIDLGPDSILC